MMIRTGFDGYSCAAAGSATRNAAASAASPLLPITHHPLPVTHHGHQSALRPAALTTLAHLVCSDLIYAPNASGDSGATSSPCLNSSSLIWGVSSAAEMS